MNNPSVPLVQITESKIKVNADTVADMKLAIKELKLKKKEFGIAKHSVAEHLKAIRTQYTRTVRTQGSMVRGGGALGKFFRAVQTNSRDTRKAQLARDLAPYERQKQQIETTIRAIDQAILLVEADILKQQSG